MVRQLSEETEMAEEVVQDSDAHNKLPLDIESLITTAMQSRVPHFKQQSEFVLLLSLSLSLRALISCLLFFISGNLSAKRCSFFSLVTEKHCFSL